MLLVWFYDGLHKIVIFSPNVCIKACHCSTTGGRLFLRKGEVKHNTGTPTKRIRNRKNNAKQSGECRPLSWKTFLSKLFTFNIISTFKIMIFPNCTLSRRVYIMYWLTPNVVATQIVMTHSYIWQLFRMICFHQCKNSTSTPMLKKNTLLLTRVILYIVHYTSHKLQRHNIQLHTVPQMLEDLLL